MSAGEADGYNDVHVVTRVRARKEHRCCACREPIARGHVYVKSFIVFDGFAETFKRCLRCQTMLDHLHEVADPMEAIDPQLDCGHTYEERHGKAPPVEIAALAFMTAEEAQRELVHG